MDRSRKGTKMYWVIILLVMMVAAAIGATIAAMIKLSELLTRVERKIRKILYRGVGS